MLNCAFLLSIGVVHGSKEKMNRRTGFQFQGLRKMFESLLIVTDSREQRSQSGVSCRRILLQTNSPLQAELRIVEIACSLLNKSGKKGGFEVVRFRLEDRT